MSQSLPKIDLFGTAINFNLAGNPKAKSKHGAICTLIFLAFVGWAIYHTSQDLFNRRDPKTNYAESYDENPRAITLTSDNFVFAFGVQHTNDNSVAHFVDDSVYIPGISWLQRKYVEGQGEPAWDGAYLETEPCTLEHFGDLSSSFSGLPLELLFCVKKDQPQIKELTLEGAFDSPFTQYLDITISKCTEFNSDVPCADNNTITSIMSGAYLVVYYSNIAINPKDSSRPDIRYRDAYYSMLCTDCYKQSTLPLMHLTVTTDYGWLFEDKEVKEYAQISTPWEQIDLRPNALGYLIDCTIELSKLEKDYTRSYVKIQDILAEVDGLATSCMVIFLVVIRPYSELKVHESLINALFDVKAPRRNKSKKKEKYRNKNNKSNQNNYRETNVELKTLKDTDINSVGKQKMKGGVSSKGSLPQMPILTIESPKSATGLLAQEKQKLETHAMKFRKQFADETSKASNTSSVESGNSQRGDVASPRQLMESLDKVKPVQKNLKVVQRLGTLKASQSESFTPLNETINRDSKSHQIQFSLNPENATKPPAKQVPDAEEPENPNFFSQILCQSQIGKEGVGDDFEVHLDDKVQVEANLESIIKGEQGNITEDQNKKQEEYKEDLFSEGENENDNNNNNNDDNVSQDEDLEGITSLNMTFWEYIRSYVWKSKTLKDKIALLNAGKRNIEERLDIYNILKKFREVDKLKALLLEDHQLVLFEALPKPEITLDSDSSCTREADNDAHSFLKKPKFIGEATKQEQMIRAYNILKNKPRKTKVDQKLLTIYDRTISPITFMAFQLKNSFRK